MVGASGEGAPMTDTERPERVVAETAAEMSDLDDRIAQTKLDLEQLRRLLRELEARRKALQEMIED
jgi:septal ring factor EnvC (AmiA/AmiB activator)